MARARKRRRELERQKRKLDDAKWKLASLGPGYSATRPITVDSASQVEPAARNMRCPACDLSFQVVEHIARPSERLVRVRCPQCGRGPEIHFVLRSSLVN